MRLFEAEERPLYYKRSATAWRHKCLTLTVEQEGFLCRVVDFMWDVGVCVPDSNAGAAMLRINVLKFRKLVAELVATGHLTRGQGHIFNTRAMREIEEWNQARIKRARVAVEREFEKMKRKKSPRVDDQFQQPYGEQPQGNPRATQGQPQGNPPSTHGVVSRLGSSSTEVASKKLNENNATQPDDCSNLHIERERKEIEKEIETPSINQVEDSGIARARTTNAEDDISPDEGSLSPGLRTAIRMLSVLFGSEDDPDTDRGYAVATEYASRYDVEDVIEAAEDFQARRRDRTEFRMITERLFAEYVRQAKANRKRREGGIAPVEKPAPKRVEPGMLADGVELAENGDIVLSNGARAEWVEKFGGNEALLDLTLIGAGSRLRPNAPTPPEAQVRSLLAGACKTIVTRRQNSVAMVEKGAELRDAANKTPNGQPKETQSERLMRMAAEMERAAKP